MNTNEEKFKFTEEYQWDLLRYIVQDKNGERALKKIRDDYFTLIPHAVIAYSLKDLYKRDTRIPGETILRERIITLLNTKAFANLATKEEQREIISLLKPLYKLPVVDGDKIYQMCQDFSNYVKVKTIIEGMDITDYDSYPRLISDLNFAVSDEDEIEDLEESFLLENIKDRQFRRQQKKTIFPTPFRQINQMTNANGYGIASILVILDKQKKGKTMALANVARGYLRMRKKILIIDLENGKDNIFFRLEQSIMKLSKLDILSGEYDDRVQKRFRKYKRLGGEVVVIRLPALVTTANDLEAKMDELYKNFGFQPDVLIIDYLAKMGSINRVEGDTARISNAYLEVGNLAEKKQIEHVWTANHVTREGAKKHQATKYEGEDIALCIDITRHSHAIFGLNRTKEEQEEGFFRLEIVEQRDGQPHGRAVFRLDMDIQRADELTPKQRREYDETFYNVAMSDDDDGTRHVSKKPRKSDI